MKKSSKIIALILGVVMCLGILAACGSDDDSSGPGTASNVVVDTSAPPPAGATFAEHITFMNDNNPIGSLDPMNPASGTTPAYWTMRMVLDSLVILRDGEFLPHLATSWNTTDYQTWTFNLRDDAYFHNGDKFTARDVEYTILRSREGIGSQSFDMWRPVDQIRIINDTTIEFVMTAVNVDFLFNIHMPSTGILNERAINADPERGFWIGTGAYKVVDFVANDYVNLERNDNYWGPTPYTRTATLRFVPEMAARTIMMQNGEAHVSMGISADDIHLFQASDDFNVIPVTFNNPNTLGFGMLHPITSDWNFRMAVMSALNRAEIAVVAAGDWASPELTGTMWGHSTMFRADNIPIVPYDLDAARNYLAASPYNGETIELATAIITNQKASEAIQQQLAQIGINIEINVFDPPGLSAHALYGSENVQLIMFVTGFTMSPAAFRNTYLPGGMTNRQTYDNPVITDLFNQAAGETDIGRREALYRQMQEIIAQDPPLINVFWRLNGIVAASNVGGLHLPGDVYYDLRYAYVLAG